MKKQKTYVHYNKLNKLNKQVGLYVVQRQQTNLVYTKAIFRDLKKAIQFNPDASFFK